MAKNSRTGMSKAYEFPEQVKFILMALLLVKNSHLMHILNLTFPEQIYLFQVFFQNKVTKIFLSGHLPVHMSVVTHQGINLPLS